MVDDGHAGIFTANSLIRMDELTALTGRLRKNCCDVIMTNPPFGSKGKISRKDILENFDLGYKWKKETKSEYYKISEKIEKNLIGGKKKGDGQIPDVLFIERCYEFLKPGGRMAIVLPDGDLSNQTLAYVRQWLTERMIVIGVISLPPHTFVPFGAGPKSSVIICVKPKKKMPKEYPVFFAKLHKIGYDVRGKAIYKRNDKGEVIDSFGKRIDQDQDTIRQWGAIDTDIPALLEEWTDFYKKNKTIQW